MRSKLLIGLAAAAMVTNSWHPAASAQPTTIRPASAQTGLLKAGAAKVDITPTPDMFPLVASQTYGSVHDPLFARALVIDNGHDKVVFISVDATQLPNGDELLAAVVDALKVPANHVIMNATHDHNAPTGGTAGNARYAAPYFAILKAGVVEAAKRADGKLQPARVGFGTGRAYVNVNRDEKIGTGFHMGYAPEGVSDKTVAVLSLTTPDGKPIAVYANYPVHGVVMYRARTKDDQVQITGDLPGATSAYVEDRLGGDAVALWTSGAAGDQNPMFMANYNQDAPDVFDEGPAGWAILDVQARRLGQEIVRVTGSIHNTADRALLWGAKTGVTCPGRQRETPPAPGEPRGGYLAPAKIPMIPGNPVTIPLSLVMINDIAVAGVSGEVYTEIGQHVKRDSLFDRTMMVTLLPNGIGYVPTDKAYLLPSEKAITNRIAPGCAEPAMIEGFRAMMESYMPVWNAARH